MDFIEVNGVIFEEKDTGIILDEKFFIIDQCHKLQVFEDNKKNKYFENILIKTKIIYNIYFQKLIYYVLQK